MEEIEVTVINWVKHNPPSDRTRHPHWFRSNRDMAMSNSLVGLEADQCWVWMQILSECCRKNSDTIKFKVAKLANFSKVTKKRVVETIELLKENDALSVHCQSTDSFVSVLCQSTARTEHTEHTEHTLQNIVTSDLANANPRTEALCNNVSELVFFPSDPEMGLMSTALSQFNEELYPDKEFLKREAIKMINWLKNNPKKKPKSKSGWHRFVSGWLERGWERYRKVIPSSQGGEINWSNVFSDKETVE